MNPVVLKPSSLIEKIKLETFESQTIFKFTDDFQERMETLLEKKQADELTPEEMTELESIGELDRIFTHINAMLLTQKNNGH